MLSILSYMIISPKTYNYDDKILLKEKISKITNKDHLISIFKLIYNDNKTAIPNNNGVHTFFHNLNDDTYAQIEDILLGISLNSTNILIEKKEYMPYMKDDFHLTDDVSAKLKFSNKEKNLIKRCRYDKSINCDNNTDIIYTQFNITSESDN